MQRFAMDKLIEWKNNTNRKPLVIMGARQVGKTWLMKEFGKLYYDKVAYISFYNNTSMSRVFEQDYDINRIIYHLFLPDKIATFPFTQEFLYLIFFSVNTDCFHIHPFTAPLTPSA